MRKKINILFVGLLLVLVLPSCVSKKQYNNTRATEIQRQDSLARVANARAIGIRQLLADSIMTSTTTQIAQLDSKKQLTMSQMRIHRLELMIEEQNVYVQTLLRNVQNALTGYGADDLSIREESGKVYVVLSDKLLFASGSTQIDNRGWEALSRLARVLNTQENIDIYVEGHTDNVPIRNARFVDNWDLSVIRATSVVRMLTENFNVNPKQIIASGRGEHLPVASNNTAESRALNRRIEIVLAPKLDQLFNLLW